MNEWRALLLVDCDYGGGHWSNRRVFILPILLSLALLCNNALSTKASLRTLSASLWPILLITAHQITILCICGFVCRWVCRRGLRQKVTLGTGASGPVVCTDAGESHGVFHTGGAVDTRGRQTGMLHWWQWVWRGQRGHTRGYNMSSWCGSSCCIWHQPDLHWGVNDNDWI